MSGAVGRLVARNSPERFWKCVVAFDAEDWERAFEAAAGVIELPGALSPPFDLDDVLDLVLGEGYLANRRWRFSRLMRAFYTMRPYLPASLVRWLRTLHHRRPKPSFPVLWPLDDRYVRFHATVLTRLLEARCFQSVSFIAFWPDSARFSFVLTHDVDTQEGHDSVLKLAELDAKYGFRSSFNFVPERYRIDRGVLTELTARGFEVGVHGLKHDGRLYSSRDEFERRAQKINGYLADWGAVGFRSPLVHRQPEWMQGLNIEYDASFFDTDPFESMPGGCLSIWPFFIGRFVELPYTLVQDHTLMISLGESTPELWLKKVDFVACHAGMALVCSHPDYLREARRAAVYERFLAAMRKRDDYWHALPRQVAAWWRDRAAIEPSLASIPDFTPSGRRVSLAEFEPPLQIHTIAPRVCNAVA
jgi:hypothetical protein